MSYEKGRHKARSKAGLSFSLRLSFFYAGVFVLGYLAIFAVADFIIRSSIADKEREIVRERIEEYRAWFLSGSVRGLRARFEEQSARSQDLVFVRLVEPSGQGNLLFGAPEGQELIDIAQLNQLAAEESGAVVTLAIAEPRNIWTVGSVRLPRGYLLQAGKISTTEFVAVERFRRVLLWALIPVTLFGVVGGGLLSYRAMKPARDLTATALSILETGELGQRVPVGHSRDDLEEMGLAFNRMLERNESLIRAMRESLDNVSHDLRTPMARLRAIAEGALSEPGDPETAREALGDCLEESERVVTMLDTLMDIAEAETGVMVLRRESVDLVALLRQVVELYELIAEEGGIRVEVELPETLEVSGDFSRLQQAMANLLDNALKYSERGGRVEVTAAREAREVVLRIADEGPGIAQQDLPRIWDRLYRGDRSRTKRGLGLGLSFVRAIAEAHGGSVEVASEEGKGSTFTLRLPG
ncbi:MAG: sensor histidine kinase [Verrucomicrobiales bacterium]